jgi:hypothetical protein
MHMRLDSSTAWEHNTLLDAVLGMLGCQQGMQERIVLGLEVLRLYSSRKVGGSAPLLPAWGMPAELAPALGDALPG